MMKINDLITQEGFTAFIQAYHQQLHEKRSFPPLGLQKALHSVSTIFGFENWQAMSATTPWESSQTTPKSVGSFALLIEYRNDSEGYGKDEGIINETDLNIYDNDLIEIPGRRKPPCFSWGIACCPDWK